MAKGYENCRSTKTTARKTRKTALKRPFYSLYFAYSLQLYQHDVFRPGNPLTPLRRTMTAPGTKRPDGPSVRFPIGSTARRRRKSNRTNGKCGVRLKTNCVQGRAAFPLAFRKHDFFEVPIFQWVTTAIKLTNRITRKHNIRIRN